MSKNKVKQLLKDTSNELERKVLWDLIDEDEPETFLRDLLNHGCQSGIVGELIYYADTKKFYVKYIEEIDELKEEMEESIGEPLKVGYPSYNWLAWFGYEETARKIADNLGLEI